MPRLTLSRAIQKIRSAVPRSTIWPDIWAMTMGPPRFSLTDILPWTIFPILTTVSLVISYV